MEDIIKKVNSGRRLAFEEAELLFEEMLKGNLTDSQIAAALISMKCRQETVEELAALVTTLERHKLPFKCDAEESIDTCGTGGDGKSTVNISTAVSIILASMGYHVVKHGNRAQSGVVGSADILDDLGIDISYSSSSPEEFFQKHNFIFMLAPDYHPALKGIGKVRREIKVPTIFNFVGPLVNPANPSCQVIGINNRDRLDFIADSVLRLGKNNITLYSSVDGYDEVSSRDKTECVCICDGRRENFTIDPGDYFQPFDMPVVQTRETARKLFIDGLTGSDDELASILALNTALALKTMKKADIPEGYHKSLAHIKSGEAMKKLNTMAGA